MYTYRADFWEVAPKKKNVKHKLSSEFVLPFGCKKILIRLSVANKKGWIKITQYSEGITALHQDWKRNVHSVPEALKVSRSQMENWLYDYRRLHLLQLHREYYYMQLRIHMQSLLCINTGFLNDVCKCGRAIIRWRCISIHCVGIW